MRCRRPTPPRGGPQTAGGDPPPATLRGRGGVARGCGRRRGRRRDRSRDLSPPRASPRQGPRRVRGGPVTPSALRRRSKGRFRPLQAAPNSDGLETPTDHPTTRRRARDRRLVPASLLRSRPASTSTSPGSDDHLPTGRTMKRLFPLFVVPAALVAAISLPASAAAPSPAPDSDSLRLEEARSRSLDPHGKASCAGSWEVCAALVEPRHTRSARSGRRRCRWHSAKDWTCRAGSAGSLSGSNAAARRKLRRLIALTSAALGDSASRSRRTSPHSP